MKVSFLFPVFLAATQFVGPAGAEPESTAERDAAVIKRYDTNQDGKLDEDEVAAVKEQMLMATQEKRDETRERLKERQAEWLKEFDKNGDGKLDEAEKKAMETALRARAEKTPRMMKRLDADGDGKLSDAEWAAAREKLIGRLQDR
ncbi:MAG TPA: EF-hand domain-containing protein [Rariglobus sp.]